MSTRTKEHHLSGCSEWYFCVTSLIIGKRLTIDGPKIQGRLPTTVLVEVLLCLLHKTLILRGPFLSRRKLLHDVHHHD